MSPNKLGYYQGGGGINEPTPGEKKYKSDSAILVQPRFKEPFYRNYDVYMTEGVDGPPKLGPGAGWHHMHEYKSIKEFLDAKRQYMKDKYKAEDSWIEDTEANRKQRIEKMKTRAVLLSKMTKQARMPGMGLIHQLHNKFKDDEHHHVKCSNCGTMVQQCRCMTKDVKYVPSCEFCKTATDDNELGYGFYENLEKYKSVRDFIEHTPLGPGHGAKIKPEWERAKHPVQKADDNKSDDNADYMLPPKEHGTKIYDWKNSPYQGKPKAPKRHDCNDIDFPVDEQIGSGSIIGDSESFESPMQLGPSGDTDTTISPGQTNLGDFESYPYSAQIGGLLDKYLPTNDFEDKTPDELDFGRDYTEDAAPQGGRRYNEDPESGPGSAPSSEIFEKLLKKYMPAPTSGLFGLPDGVDLPDEDLGDPTNINPDYGTTDVGITMYEDKWNI